MALRHTPLEQDRLGPAAHKALTGPPGLRLMAARGLAPLPRPADLVSVLYQLALDPDAAIAGAASKSAGELPDAVIRGALADATLDPRVVDFFAPLAARRPGVLEVLVLNVATADETVAELAQRAGETEVDVIAANEERMLRHPAIIAALYLNKHARMSVVDRAVEMAVRRGVRVPGIAAWDEVVAAVVGPRREVGAAVKPADMDALFSQVANRAAESPETIAAALSRIGKGELREVDDEAPPEDDGEEEAGVDAAAEEAVPEAPELRTPLSQMTIPMKIRMALIGNAFVRAELVRDTNRMVSAAAIKSPGVTELEARKYAGNPALSDDVIGYIASRRDWTRLYNIKAALVHNPKTPIGPAMRLVTHLRDKDIKVLARSKGVSSALVAQARKILQARETRNSGKRR